MAEEKNCEDPISQDGTEVFLTRKPSSLFLKSRFLFTAYCTPQLPSVTNEAGVLCVSIQQNEGMITAQISTLAIMSNNRSTDRVASV